MSCGVGRRCSLDPVLLWLWCRQAAVTPIRPLAWELPYATGEALKRQKTKKPHNTLSLYYAIPRDGEFLLVILCLLHCWGQAVFSVAEISLCLRKTLCFWTLWWHFPSVPIPLPLILIAKLCRVSGADIDQEYLLTFNQKQGTSDSIGVESQALNSFLPIPRDKGFRFALVLVLAFPHQQWLLTCAPRWQGRFASLRCSRCLFCERKPPGTGQGFKPFSEWQLLYLPTSAPLAGGGGGVFLSLLLSLELPCEHPVEKSVEKILGVRANSPQVCDSHAFYIIMLSRCGPLEILLKSSSLLLTHLSGSFSFLPCSFTGELVCASWLSWGSPALLGFCATWWSCEVSSLMDSSVMLHFF